jgi:hypothetical protein
MALFTLGILARELEMVMQALSKAALLALGLSISGAAMADQYFGGPLQYSQYTYNPSYPAYSSYYGGYPYYPAYSGYGYPAYGWYSARPYAWAYSYWNPSAPYSRVNPNWVPYAGWR